MSLVPFRRKPEAAPAQAETRALLLRAAGEVFAAVGFRSATVREICRRAGANVAAVNYHFGDKERLYLEVLRYSQDQALRKYPPDLGVSSGAPVERRLLAFVRSLMLRMFDAGPTAWHGKLLALEMIEPTGALDTLVQERFRPMADQLAGMVRSILGPGVSEEQVRLCHCSIISQCVFYYHCRSVVSRLFPEQGFSNEEIERLSEHITRFSLAALAQLARQAKSAGAMKRRRRV